MSPTHPQAGLKDSVIEQCKTELADKGKAKANNRAGALRACRALVEKFGTSAEAVVMPMLGETLEALADKLKPVSVEAEKLQNAICDKMSPYAVKVHAQGIANALCRNGHNSSTPDARHAGATVPRFVVSPARLLCCLTRAIGWS